jgi:hypothetical protein
MDNACVPGADGTNDTERGVAGGENLLIVLNTLLGEVKRQEVAEEGRDHVDFHGSELALLLISKCLEMA